jgi:hypothetical protein
MRIILSCSVYSLIVYISCIVQHVNLLSKTHYTGDMFRLPSSHHKASVNVRTITDHCVCLCEILNVCCQTPDRKMCLTLSLLMLYIYGAPCKTRNFNAVYIWTYVWQRWKLSLSICCKMFQHWINAESYLVSQLCVNTLPATRITLIADGI